MRARAWNGLVASTLFLGGCTLFTSFDGLAGDPSVAGDSNADAAPPSPRQTDAAVSDDATSDAPRSVGPCSPDVTTDGKNCGRCGHSCLGAMCKDGACEPVPLASDLARPVPTMAVDGKSVYWSNGDEGFHVPLTGGFPTRDALASHAGSVTAVAVDASGVYWAYDSQINLSPPGGGASARFGLAAFACIDSVALDDKTVYVSDSCQGGRILSFLKADAPTATDGRLIKTLTLLNLQAPRIPSLTLGDGRVFWALSDNGPTSGKTASIAADGSGIVATLGTTQRLPTSIVADPAAVFWTEHGTAPDFLDGRIEMKSLPGGATKDFLTSIADIGSLLLDATYLYWTSQGQGPTYADAGIYRAPRVGGEKTRLAVAHHPIALTADAAWIYWAEAGDPLPANPMTGAVLKVAK